MKRRIKRLLAVFLVMAAVANCLHFSGYEMDVSAVTGLVGNESAESEYAGETMLLDEQADTEAEGTYGEEVIETETEIESETETEADQEGETEHDMEIAMGTQGDNAGKVDTTDDSEPEAQDMMLMGASVEEVITEENLGYSASASTNIPQTVNELTTDGKTEYKIATYDDVLALQALSQLDSLAGYTFTFQKLDNTSESWMLNTLTGFEGFGSETYPFQGTLNCYYGHSVGFTTKKPIFNYLGSQSTVKNLKITLDSASSGMANYLVLTSDCNVTYENVILSGTIKNTAGGVNGGAAGGLYGTVVNKTDTPYTLTIDGSGPNLTNIKYVDALIAGGYVGRVQGKVAVQVFDASNLAPTVYCTTSNATAIGGIIGKLESGSSFTVMNAIEVSNWVGCRLKDNVTNMENNASYEYSQKPSAVGGLIGSCEGTTVNSMYKVIKSTGTYLQGGTAGGYIGRVNASQVTISNFVLNDSIKTGVGGTGVGKPNLDGCAGGVVGIYQTEDGDQTSYMDISNVGIDGMQIAGGDDSDYNNGNTNKVEIGGIVGSIQGNQVKIHNLHDSNEADQTYLFKPAVGYDSWDAWNTCDKLVGNNFPQAGPGIVGGIAGTVKGKNIEFYDLKLSFEEKRKLGGKYVGGLVGKVQEDTKVRVSNLTINSLFIIYKSGSANKEIIPYYAGGLFGYVDKGSIICLKGTIDLSGISYLDGAENQNGLRAKNAKGYIAGAQTESLIYLETGATYKKNITVQDSENDVWTEDYVGYTKNYTLDDIGTYGGVYKNVDSVIDFTQPYGFEVTGTVGYDSTSNTYTLNGDADALRLAIALNTFKADSGNSLRFTSGCFQSGNADALLGANYVLTGDLDFNNTGIYSLVRNDSTSYSFTGSITGQKSGSDRQVTICQNTVSTQEYAGLFPYVKNASFQDLKLTGKIYYPDNFGGLAYRAEGNLTLSNVDNDIKMRTGSYVPVDVDTNKNKSLKDPVCYGGYVGIYNLGTSTFTCTDCEIAPDISNIRVQQIVGGLAGYIYTGTTTPANDNIILSNTTVSAKLTTDSKFRKGIPADSSNSSAPVLCQARMSGLIATLSTGRWVNQNQTDGTETWVTDATYAKVHMTNITVNGAKIDNSNIAASDKPENVRATGGFLGYQWNNAEVVIDGATGVKVTGNSEIKSRGHVGGLFTTFSGKLDFNSKITLDSMTMTDVQGDQKFSGLLVGDGRYAMVTLTDANYTIGETVTVSGYSNFDEIVGVNYELTDNEVNKNACSVVGDYKQGGVVNIILPEFKTNMVADTYKSYVNRVSTQDNQYTRYYYNLFTGSNYSNGQIAVTGNTATLDSEEDLMIWHLYEYTAGSKLNRFIKPYFTGNVDLNGTWNLKPADGTFDMEGYSFYPTRVTGGTYVGGNGADISAVIKLYAKEITDGEGSHSNTCDQRTPDLNTRQHYMMHAGLFQNSSNFNVSGVTFQGTAANLGTDSGVLCAKSLRGAVTIRDITLDGVVINGYTDVCGVGLMLSWVQGEQDDPDVENRRDDNTDLSIVGVKTENYSTGTMAAGALIGRVGSPTANDFKVSMQNMNVEDEPDKVFKYASFICKYDYSSAMDKDTNKIVLYTFSKADVDGGNVTYGSEMKDGVNYYDADRVNGDTLSTAIENAASYLPYVHRQGDTGRYIFVNPRNGNLVKGCGTYEDPYVISTSRQLMNLYLYLTDSGSYEEFFKVPGNEWKVNRVGNGQTDGRCNVDSSPVSEHTVATYGSGDNFPTRDELRTAYYSIQADLNLNTVQDMNDLALNCDFVGLGTEKYPFAGVIVGKKTGGICPTITLPATASSAENYGLIQYMKGGVVKDLQIKQGANSTISISQTGNGAAVAAVVLGGDNIIDNVNVDLTLTVAYVSDMSVKTGAYVGCVKSGGVILRNLSHENVDGYSVTYNGNGNTGETGSYRKNCRIIGWVEDGYVLGNLAGDDRQESAPLIENGQLGFTEASALPLSDSFPIINEAYLNKGFESNKIQVTGDSTSGFTVTMHNAQQLEVATLGMNSDAFSIYDSGAYDVNNTNAYDYRAICRKANYSQVGCGYAAVHPSEGTSLPQDFETATQKDDGQRHYPYIYYKYMDFSALAGDYRDTLNIQTTGEVTATLSYLNWTTENPDVVPTYVLDTDENTGSTDYDLSIYGRSFRGIGGLYHPTYSQFRANFNGNGANVIINMVRDWDSSITTTGMFNGLETVREGDGFTIQNLNIKNSHFENNNADSVGGALTGYMKGIWTLKDVYLVRDTANSGTSKDVHNFSHTGGLVGVVGYSTDSAYNDIQKIKFLQCGITGENEAKVLLNSEANIGGILGYVDGYNNAESTEQKSYYGNIFFIGCQVQNAEVNTTGGNAGGFIGRVGDSYQHYIDHNNTQYGRSVGTVSIRGTESAGGETYPDAVKNSSITVEVGASAGDHYGAGGLVGVFASRKKVSSDAESQMIVDGIVLDTVRVNSNSTNPNDSYVGGIGGIAGGTWTDTMKVSNVTVKASTLAGTPKDSNSSTTTLPAAGIVGTSYMSNLAVENVVIGENTTVTSYSNAVAGVLAYNRKLDTFKGQNVTIAGSKFMTNMSASAGVLARNSISNISSMNVNGIDISGSKFYAGCKDESQTITVTGTGEVTSAGGVIGYSTQRINKLSISNVEIGDNTSLAGYNVGGVIGHIQAGTPVVMSGYVHVGCHEETEASGKVVPDTTNNPASAVTIYGKNKTGGLIGNDTTTASGRYDAAIRVYNTRVGAYATGSYTAMAGGLVGYSNSHDTVFDDVEVKKCFFVANSIGGGNPAVGALWALVESYTHKIYRPVLEDNSIGYVNNNHSSKIESLNAFQSLAIDDEGVGLVHNRTKTDTVKWSNANLSESNVGEYSYGMGNYVGEIRNGSIYILRPQLTYSDGFTGNRPAIDVGNTTGKGATNYDTEHGYGFPYAYRERVHIVYFEPDAVEGDTQNNKYKEADKYLSDALIAESVVNGSAGEAGEKEYLFSSLDTFAAAYQDENNTGAGFLSDYNLNMLVGGKKVIHADKSNTDSYYDMPDSSPTTENPKKYIKTLNGVQCLYADGVGAQNLLESMLDILTNAGGGDTTKFGDNLEMKAVSAKITAGGKIVDNSTERPDASVVVNNSDKTVSYRQSGADEYSESDGSYTITLLICNYGWTGADGERKSETIYIPVFVVERITLYNDLRILEGEQYSLERAKDSAVSYQGSVTVSHDSTYTLYSELAYSPAREKEAYQNFTINKSLQLRQIDNQEWKPANIPKGLNFTLVDVSNGKAYYYTSTGTETEIEFTMFLDENNNPYQYQTIGNAVSQAGYSYDGETWTEDKIFGVERFFIYVEPSPDASITNSIFQWSISTEKTNANIENFLDQKDQLSKIKITWIPGMDISFETVNHEETVKLEVEDNSAISRDKKVNVSAAFNISVKGTYWDEKKAAMEHGTSFIDSENNGKYVDVAIYLIDKETGEYVTLPPGTYLRLNGEATGQATSGQSVTYAYQQWGNTFPLSKVMQDVQGWNQNISDGESIYSNTFELEMDFAAADLDDYVGKNYDLYMELRRTSDPEYPLEGSMLDSHSWEIAFDGNKELGTTVEVKDIVDLGINTYKETDHVHSIKFTTKLDFANMIYNDADLEASAAKDYLITYRIRKKIQTGTDTSVNPVYEYKTVGSVNNSQTIGDTDRNVSGLNVNEKLTLSLPEGQEGSADPVIFNEKYGINDSEEPVYQMVKRFTDNEIKNGINGVKYLMTWDLTLTVNTENIDNFDLSNYMVEVTVLPFDRQEQISENFTTITTGTQSYIIPKTDSGVGSDSTLRDYYIFTIGKLKTDL